jgi:hypothetical protein
MALRILIACHILAGATATLAGAAAMLAPKRPGPHPRRGRTYLLALTVTLASGTGIAVTTWPRFWHLAVLGGAAATLAGVGLAARRIRFHHWLPVHITAMASSYTTMLTAFYVDNGPRLPLWNVLPPQTFWILPTATGLPLLIRALHKHKGRA